MRKIILAALAATLALCASAQEKVLLNEGWIMKRADEVLADGNTISKGFTGETGWMKATVPGTVLTSLINNGIFPAPEFGLDNEKIPDIYNIGRDFYTYWFVKRFDSPKTTQGRHVWLNFRGINYKADIFLNGKRLNNDTLEGMFLRHSFDITEYLSEEGVNTLAVIVFPPVYPGKPNGGQGGDGMIARNCTMQYTPGWDWVQAVKDRNTGIWDEVSLTTTGSVKLAAPYVVTKVPGVRMPDSKKQDNATVMTTVELSNITSDPVQGTLKCITAGQTLSENISLQPFETRTFAFKDLKVKNPKLWWPNGIGEHPLYDMDITFETGGKVQDRSSIKYGIREITTSIDPSHGGRTFFVNGQKVYVTGGNYINSDWLLRLSPERYEDEVRFHEEMNVRMIRVWGGALLERPEFYDACDRHGILVFQDLWGSGDCNGAWVDPLKTETRERRWEYPDNHSLFLEMARDQIKMIRNHPSLCLWCGANEWPLAKDIDKKLKDEVFPELDPERLFISFSTDTLFTAIPKGNSMDGPYTIQEPEWFFTFRSNPFNPEAGNVGSPEVESMRAFMSEEDLAEVPQGKFVNPVWTYHKDLGYRGHLERYGKVTDIETYCKYAQLVNYDQYRSFMEGWASHLWDWYTGILIWKTQNPWPGLRGQMYDWYLDVNASLYGTAKGCEPLHPFYNIVTRKAELLNTSLIPHKGLTVKAEIFSRNGKLLWDKSEKTGAEANNVKELFDIPTPEGVKGVYFLKLTLIEGSSQLTDNIYWLTTDKNDYTTLSELPESKTNISSSVEVSVGRYRGKVTLSSDGISFFNRIKLFDSATGQRILPVHWSDNYITLMPGDSKTASFDFPAEQLKGELQIKVQDYKQY